MERIHYFPLHPYKITPLTRHSVFVGNRTDPKLQFDRLSPKPNEFLTLVYSQLSIFFRPKFANLQNSVLSPLCLAYPPPANRSCNFSRPTPASRNKEPVAPSLATKPRCCRAITHIHTSPRTHNSCSHIMKILERSRAQVQPAQPSLHPSHPRNPPGSLHREG